MTLTVKSVLCCEKILKTRYWNPKSLCTRISVVCGQFEEENIVHAMNQSYSIKMLNISIDIKTIDDSR